MAIRGKLMAAGLLALLAGCAHAPPAAPPPHSQDLGDLLQSSCDGGSALACETLARALEVADGRGEQRDRIASLRKKACALGYQGSCAP